MEGQGLKLLRNDGGNANQQLKLRLIGNRSNASGLGIRLEVTAGPFRVHRTVTSLPVEIGVGQHDKLDSLVARWFDLAFNQIDVKPDPTAPPCRSSSRSCPRAPARTSMPGTASSSASLPTFSAPRRWVCGSPTRFLPMPIRTSMSGWATHDRFPPRDGRYTVQITEELREVLYLDEAKLVVVDHPPGTEVAHDRQVPSRQAVSARRALDARRTAVPCAKPRGWMAATSRRRWWTTTGSMVSPEQHPHPAVARPG